MEDDTPEEDGPFSANSVGQWPGEESSHQGTDGELESVNFFLHFFYFFFPRHAMLFTHHGNNQSRPDIVKPIRPIRLQLRKPLLEVPHLQKARDLTSIISENDTTNRDKAA